MDCARVYLYKRKDIFHNRPISLSTDCYFLEVLDISETNSVPLVLHYLFPTHYLFSNFWNRTRYFGKQNDSFHRRRNEQVCSVWPSSLVGSKSFHLRKETNSDFDASFTFRNTRSRTMGKV